MDRNEAVETLYQYALQVPNDLMFGESAKIANEKINEAYGALKATISQDIENDEESEQDLIHIYGSKENMLKLRPLTNDEVYEIQREKLLTYLSWDNELDSRRDRWKQELKELDDYYNKSN